MQPPDTNQTNSISEEIRPFGAIRMKRLGTATLYKPDKYLLCRSIKDEHTMKNKLKLGDIGNF